MKRKTITASGVAISERRALTVLHGKIPLNKLVTITTRNRTKMFGRVEPRCLEEWSFRDLRKTWLMLLDFSAVFHRFMPYSDQPVRLAQPTAVVGLTYASSCDTVGTYLRSVESIEDLCDYVKAVLSSMPSTIILTVARRPE